MGTTYINSYNFPLGKITLSADPAPSATITTYSGYIVFRFTATGTLNVGAGAPGTADVFALAGGNSGSPGSGNDGGPGGAGGARTATPAVAITGGVPIPVVVGGSNTNSTFGPITSSGGTAGGSGGNGGLRTGFIPATVGGTGPSNNYETGSPKVYGGGGGGGGWSPLNPGAAGGNAGGGPGGQGGRLSPFPTIPGTPGTAGTVNTGGGGGGGGGGHPFAVGGGGAGGSGVVVIRFPTTEFQT